MSISYIFSIMIVHSLLILSFCFRCFSLRSIFPYVKVERSSPTSLTIDTIMWISFLLVKDSHQPIVVVRLGWNSLYEQKALRIQYRVCQMFHHQLKVEPLSLDHMIGTNHGS
jgi:hypothetical protein